MFGYLDKIILWTLLFNFRFFCDVYGEGLRPENMERDARDRVGMWFGPRLGKRSHATIANDNGRREAITRMLEAADVMKFYYDMLPPQYSGLLTQSEDADLQVPKQSVFSSQLVRGFEAEEKRSHDVDMTPRLGRRSSRDPGVTASGAEFYRNDAVPIEGRSPYLSPRLGRSFTPRLGRNLAYDYPDNVRVARSVDKNATDSGGT